MKQFVANGRVVWREKLKISKNANNRKKKMMKVSWKLRKRFESLVVSNDKVQFDDFFYVIFNVKIIGMEFPN